MRHSLAERLKQGLEEGIEHTWGKRTLATQTIAAPPGRDCTQRRLFLIEEERNGTATDANGKGGVMEKDYLDELIESNIQRDSRFAVEWPSAEAALSLLPCVRRPDIPSRKSQIERDPSRVSFARVPRYAAAVGARFDLVSD